MARASLSRTPLVVVVRVRSSRLPGRGPLPDDLKEAIDRTRADYERWLDARYAAARGHCDAVIDPNDTRLVLSYALEACS